MRAAPATTLMAGDIDLQFFADFKNFADVMSWPLANEYTASRFRLEDLPDGDLSLNVDHDSSPLIES